MAESSQEKTEHATPKRLRDARKKGDVAKSRDLTMILVMVVVFATIAFTARDIGEYIKEFMRRAFDLISQNEITSEDMWDLGKRGLLTLVKVLGPIFVAGVMTALLVGIVQVGGIFSTEPLKPKMQKLNPLEGFKNIFKVVTLIELLKNIAKISLVIYLAYQTIKTFIAEILLTSKVRIEESVGFTGSIVYSFFVKVAAVFLAIALIDMGVQRWNYMKRHKMSKDEVKREYKQDEGDPQIRGERRRLHREMVMGDVRRNVKRADTVVTNPIQVAVAIQYDRKEMAAPEVVAKGQRKWAEMIIQIAKEEHVPIIRNIPLAWSLLQVDEGDAIPEDLYEPVAEVLTFVYEMKEKEVGQQTTTQQKAPAEEIKEKQEIVKL